MTYRGELCRSMQWLAEQPKVLFLGQAVRYSGTAMSGTLAEVPAEQRIELPVMEEAQLGMCIGLALSGYVPVCIYPRFNFLLLAMNQLVNHLDKLPHMGYKPGVIIRVGVGSEHPLDPGPQHKGDVSSSLESMLDEVSIFKLDAPEDVLDAYQGAYHKAIKGESTIVVEMSDYYDERYRLSVA